MSEIEKYRGIYADDRFHRYGHTNHGAAAIPILEREGITQVLDLGCGWNEFARTLRDRGLRAIGYDFACPGADVIHDVASSPLPFPARSWQCVTAFDMLEHLLPDQVDGVLREMARVSTRFIVSICYRDSSNRWQGETLHPTVRPESWWIDALTRAGAVRIRKIGHYLTGHWERALDLPPATRVILVGNGPSLLEAERGEEIDAFDFVVRFNDYHVAGYERHVGTRIDLWSTVGSQCRNELACPRALLINGDFEVPPSVREGYPMPRTVYEMIRVLVRDRAWIRSGLRTDYSGLLGSSGLMAAIWFLDLVGIERVTLVGFDHFRKDRSKLHHYWWRKSVKRPTQHDGDVEAEIFAELEAAGRVRYLS